MNRLPSFALLLPTAPQIGRGLPTMRLCLEDHCPIACQAKRAAVENSLTIPSSPQVRLFIRRPRDPAPTSFHWFAAGDTVWVPHAANGALKPSWKRPYTVILSTPMAVEVEETWRLPNGLYPDYGPIKITVSLRLWALPLPALQPPPESCFALLV